ncbi:MAG TPA: response regulator [Pseudolabrys sp.]|nr:response regulator [Pseudolabrys sp.]
MNGDNDTSEALPTLTGLRVLLVEDVWQVGVALKRLLQGFNAKVDGPVATTADAERLISEHVPDAAVVDINLRQGEQSYDLIDRLVDQGVPVIVISGYSDLRRVTAKAHTLDKPVSQEKLIALLRSVVDAR